MNNRDPPNHPSSSSSSSSSSVTDTLMNYLITATTKSQEAFEHARDFGHKASEQLSYAAAQGPGPSPVGDQLRVGALFFFNLQ